MYWNSLEKRVLPILQQAMSQGVFTRAVLGVLNEQGETRIYPVSEDPHFASDSVFDLASLSKCVPTSTLALMRLIRGDLQVEDRVDQWIPELRMRHRHEIRLFHLLTHTLDYRIPMSTLKDLPAEQIWETLFSYEFAEAPGSCFNYGNPASVLLGLLLERLENQSLDVLGEREVFSPLAMKDTGWNPLQRVDKKRIVSTEECLWRGRALQGEVHDESAYSLKRPVGSAGVFGTAQDLLRLLKFYLMESPSLKELASTNALSHLTGQGAALGWELCNRRFMGEQVSAKAFGKTGFTGMSLVADPECQSAVVLLCDFTWPQREKTVDRIYELRRSVHNEIFALIKS